MARVKKERNWTLAFILLSLLLITLGLYAAQFLQFASSSRVRHKSKVHDCNNKNLTNATNATVAAPPKLMYPGDPSFGEFPCVLNAIYNLTKPRSKPKVFRIGMSDDIQLMVNCMLAEALVHVYLDEDTDVEVVMRARNGSHMIGWPDSRVDILIGLGWFMTENLTDHHHLPHRDLSEDEKKTLKAAGVMLYAKRKFVTYTDQPSPMLGGKVTPLTVAMSGEAWDFGHCRYSLMFINSLIPKFHCPTIYWPTSVRFMSHRWTHTIDDLVVKKDFNPQKILDKKVFFGAMLVKICYHKSYGTLEPLIRTIIFILLSEYKPVFSLGGCKPATANQAVMQNTTYIARGGGPVDGPVGLFEHFKFVITAENNGHSGYMTEKLVNGILANTVPIYWGSTDVTQVVNGGRFVFCHAPTQVIEQWNKMGSHMEDVAEVERVTKQGVELFRQYFKPCIQEVIHLDKNDGAYLNKLTHPFLPNNKVKDSMFDVDFIARKIRVFANMSGVRPRVENEPFFDPRDVKVRPTKYG